MLFAWGWEFLQYQAMGSVTKLHEKNMWMTCGSISCLLVLQYLAFVAVQSILDFDMVHSLKIGHCPKSTMDDWLLCSLIRVELMNRKTCSMQSWLTWVLIVWTQLTWIASQLSVILIFLTTMCPWYCFKGEGSPISFKFYKSCNLTMSHSFFQFL